MNKHGARIVSGRALPIGSEVTVVVEATQRSQQARVVWEDQPGRHDYGIELSNPENFWGISFPPEDWEMEAHGAAV